MRLPTHLYSKKKGRFILKISFISVIAICIFVFIFVGETDQTEKNITNENNKIIPNTNKNYSLNFTEDNISLTIVCLPYPVSNARLRDRYLVTMSSWLLTASTTKIMILMPPHEFDPDMMILPLLYTLFGKDRITFGPSIEYDEDGVPYIDEWFIKGLDAAETSLVCWINADIITPKGWLPRILYLYDYFLSHGQQISVISRRCDFNFSDQKASEFFLNINNSDGKDAEFWPPDFDKLAETRKLHSTWGIDFFLVAKEPMQINFDDIPPFHLGKYRWDPWITGWLRKHMPLVTLGNDFCTYHLNHIPKSRQMDDVKVKENFEEARRHNNYKVPNGLASYSLEGRYLYKKHQKEPIDKIYDSIPLANAPPDDSKNDSDE